MMTFKMALKITSVIAALGTLSVVALASDPNLDSSTEYGLSCSSGGCIDRTNFVASNERNLLHRVNIFSADLKDHRVELKTVGTGKVFAPIGRIEPTLPIPTENDGLVQSKDLHATAFLVSPCYIMTNYHAVFGVAPMEKMDQQTATFYVGIDPKTGKPYEIKATPVAHGAFLPTQATGEDWALLKLTKCAGLVADIGWMEFAPADLIDYKNKNLKVAGFAGDHDWKKLWVDDSCHSHGFSGEGVEVMHDCATSGGDSGGPGYYMDHGIPKVVFMNEGSNDSGASILGSSNSSKRKTLKTWDNGNSNVGLDIRGLLASAVIPEITMNNVKLKDVSLDRVIGIDRALWNVKNPAVENIKSNQVLSATSGHAGI
jgi:V8-like Glu-specific endopeptidase